MFSAALFLRNTVLPRMPLSVTPEMLHLPSDTVHFQASDGVPLEGWKIIGQTGKPWLVMCHGLGSNRADLLEIATGLSKTGFNMLLFDFRGHGGSAGRVTSFGALEQRDLEGALAFLGRQPDVPAKPYGVYGISMGGAVALMVAARDERLGAVAADSPYEDLQESLGRHLSLMYPLPKIPFLWFMLSTYRLRFGVWPSQLSPRQAAAQLSPRAVFLINGANDPRMPAEGARRLFEQAGEPKSLWLVDSAGHLEAYSLNPLEYLQRLIGFFEKHLAATF